MPNPALAQERTVETGLIDGVAACLDIRDDARRLACSDLAARKLVDAVRKKEVVVVDRNEVRSTRRSLFGFPLPRIGLFGRDGPDKDAEELDRVEAIVASAAETGYQKLSFTLADGARWTTTEAWTASIPKAGSTIIIKKASLGGYFVSAKGTRAVRAMRVG